MEKSASSNGEGGAMFCPHDYFKARRGLCMSTSLRNNLLKNAPTAISRRGLNRVRSQKLTRAMTIPEISDPAFGFYDGRKLGEHVFTLDQMGTLIDLQSKGEYGRLPTNGEAAVFPVLINAKIVFLSVDWSTVTNDWSMSEVDDPFFHGGILKPGTMIFQNTTLVLCSVS